VTRIGIPREQMPGKKKCGSGKKRRAPEKRKRSLGPMTCVTKTTEAKQTHRSRKGSLGERERMSLGRTAMAIARKRGPKPQAGICHRTRQNGEMGGKKAAYIGSETWWLFWSVADDEGCLYISGRKSRHPTATRMTSHKKSINKQTGKLKERAMLGDGPSRRVNFSTQGEPTCGAKKRKRQAEYKSTREEMIINNAMG